MFKDGKPKRDASGKIIKAASYQSKEIPKARIEPNRKWFSNTRVISQEALAAFREAVAEKASDPYQVLLKTNKLPMSLIRDSPGINGLKQHKAKMTVEQEPFSETFGPKAQRKRVKLGVGTLEDLADETVKMHDSYVERLDQQKLLNGNSGSAGDDADGDDGTLATAREPVFSKGQSKRIWNELYKVIDSSDVVIHVLDARDPEGTRCRSIEKYIREEAPHKHLVFVLNKCDLVPTSVAVSCLLLIISSFFAFRPISNVTRSIAKSRLLPCNPLHISPWKFVCYSFGRSTLAPPPGFFLKFGLTSFRFESVVAKGQVVFCLELSTASAFWWLRGSSLSSISHIILTQYRSYGRLLVANWLLPGILGTAPVQRISHACIPCFYQ